MIRLFMDNALFYSFDNIENPEDYNLTSMTLKKEVNTLSSLSISFLSSHPRSKSIVLRRSTFLLAEDNECLFIGKVLTINHSLMSEEYQLDIEEITGCLRDTPSSIDREDEVDPQEDPDSGLTPEYDISSSTYEYLFYDVSNQLYPSDNSNTSLGYNSLYTLPTAYQGTIVDSYNISSINSKLNDQIDVNFIGKDYLNILNDYITGWIGGVCYLNVVGNLSNEHTQNVKYMVASIELIYNLDYLSENISRNNDGELNITKSNVPISFEFGKNILSMDVEPSISNPYSGVLPYAACTLTINGQSVAKAITVDGLYVFNSKAKNKLGKIVKAVDFGDLGDSYANIRAAATKLKSIAQSFVDSRLMPIKDRMVVTGIKNSLLQNGTIGDPLLQLIRIKSTAHNIDYVDRCLSYEIDFFDHSKDRYIVGPYLPSNYLEYNSSNTKNIKKEMKYTEGASYSPVYEEALPASTPSGEAAMSLPAWIQGISFM